MAAGQSPAKKGEGKKVRMGGSQWRCHSSLRGSPKQFGKRKKGGNAALAPKGPTPSASKNVQKKGWLVAKKNARIRQRRQKPRAGKGGEEWRKIHEIFN